MIDWVVIFLILAIVAGALGFGGISIVSVEIAKLLFFIFLLLFVASLVMKVLRK
ncbi:MAG: DUF1328 domain-containing protein [Candidatus Dependentiae bacterium]|jgi:uncharacterized membrane protein YtjA (UPF0391 family)